MDRISVSLKEKANLMYYNMNELIKEGSKLEYKEEYVSPDDLFIIMYTSGTTGNPKVCNLNLSSFQNINYYIKGSYDNTQKYYISNSRNLHRIS